MKTLLKNGLIADGAGGELFRADLLIVNERIAAVAPAGSVEDAQAIDCAGCVVAPGFIDAHSHSDLQLLENRREKTAQGVTSEVVGNCGFSTFPAPPERQALYEFANPILCGGEEWGWPSAKQYLEDTLARCRVATVAALVGHGTLRIAAAGNRQGPLERREMERMEGLLDECLAEGACGFSTGLMYAPGSSAPIEELDALCRIVARRGAIYATHMRSYAFGLLDSVREQIGIARRTGCRLQISHLQTVGPANWPLQQRALEEIERAAQEGLDVAFDCYPYTAGSTVMTQFLPQWSLDGGIPALLGRLADPGTRARIAAETVQGLAQRWSDIFVSAAANPAVIGRDLETLAGERGREPVEVMLDLIAEESGKVNIVSFNQSEENLRALVGHPLANIVSDGFYVKGRPHPRLFGTFPRLLGEVRRDRGWLTLPEAVHKITAKPARRFGFKARGLLQPGYHADIVVFDPDQIGSPATYENPEAAPAGIRHVFRQGRRIEL